MVQDINITITDNSKKNKGKNKGQKKKEKTPTKKQRKTRKDKGIPRKKKADPPPTYEAATQRGTYAYNVVRPNVPIHLDSPFVEQSKIQISTLQNKLDENSKKQENINTKINETIQQATDFNQNVGTIIKKQVVDNLNDIYKPPSMSREARRGQMLGKKYSEWHQEGSKHWDELSKGKKITKKSGTFEGFVKGEESELETESYVGSSDNSSVLKNKLKPPPLSTTMSPSINRLSITEPIDNPPSLVDIEQFKNDILGAEEPTENKPRRKPRFEFRRVYKRYDSS